MTAELVLFYLFGGISVISALAMVGFVRNIVAGAMSLVLTMISLAVIYLLMGAYLVSAIQIMVYAGAILVLFLFVIMLLNLRTDDFGAVRAGQAFLKTCGAIAALAILAIVLGEVPALPAPAEVPADFGGYRNVGVALFTEFAVPVETAGLILLGSIVGAVILAKRKIR